MHHDRGKVGDSFKFTLYEFFGYLIPGAVTLIALGLLDLVLFHDYPFVYLGWCSTKIGVAAGVGIAYVLGHGVQIFANSVLPKTNDRVLKSETYKGTRLLLGNVRKCLPESVADFSDAEVISMCEQEVQTGGPSGDREIYIYREGFYRGMLISLSTACVASLLIGAVNRFAESALKWGTHRSESFLAAILLGAMAAGMYKRSIRFANYRIKQALTCHILQQLASEGKGTTDV